jgi:indole-3-glycerol phosphate synthase
MTTEAPDLLVRIADRRRERLGGEGMAPAGGPRRERPLDRAENPFLAALAARRGAAIIAEVKLASPRLGPLPWGAGASPEATARAYAAAGAAALSVVVEPDFFAGDYDLLARCRRASGLPAIAKDFLVDSRQLDWARAAGADAVLLIAALHSAAELRAWAAAARGRGLVPLVETHDAGDLAKLDGAEWELVGVNQRDLRSFTVDGERALRLAPGLPAGALRVAESGISRRVEIERLAAAGFDAFLIGESLLLAPDPGAKLAELLGQER